MNIVFRVYFYFMWFVGTPVMIIFILVNTFISYDTIAGYYGFDNPEDGIDIYPAWCNNFGTFFNHKFIFCHAFCQIKYFFIIFLAIDLRL